MLTQAEQHRKTYLRRKLRRQINPLLFGDTKQFNVLSRMLKGEYTDDMLELWRTELGDKTLKKLKRIVTDYEEHSSLWEKSNEA